MDFISFFYINVRYHTEVIVRCCATAFFLGHNTLRLPSDPVGAYLKYLKYLPEKIKTNR